MCHSLDITWEYGGLCKASWDALFVKAEVDGVQVFQEAILLWRQAACVYSEYGGRRRDGWPWLRELLCTNWMQAFRNPLLALYERTRASACQLETSCTRNGRDK
ncbi:hypothetical protein M758_6G094100 [Ceratodon purpureus]|uniref:Uncharacterized protein n=1 Tax=Ceratodon purpureus TaxID=3225 RepID=A0A8T0HEZ1_CERPU|nr:hypothetical protein KC19_6G097800 [Ceratodon purpureus]KAG0613320.1 hypothetical protein M758_6G094100 [Ceratodon purpureus]